MAVKVSIVVSPHMATTTWSWLSVSPRKADSKVAWDDTQAPVVGVHDGATGVGDGGAMLLENY